MQYATVQFYVDGPSDPATGPPTLGRSDRSSYRLTKRSFIRTAPCVLKSVFCSIAPRTPHSALPISHPRPRRNFSSRHLLPRCVNTVDHTIPVTSPLPGALRLSHKCGTTFLRVINGMTGNPVRGAKPWAAAHYFLAAIRRDRVYTSCAIATARFRAKPSRA